MKYQIPEEPECRLGYTSRQVERLVGSENLDSFHDWMYGQTIALCTDDLPCPQGHGPVVYAYDLGKWLSGNRRIFD